LPDVYYPVALVEKLSGENKNGGEADIICSFNNSNNLPSVYDYFVFNALEQQLSDNSVFDRPSNEFYKELTSDNLKFHSTAITDDPIYAPTTWKNGVCKKRSRCFLC